MANELSATAPKLEKSSRQRTSFLKMLRRKPLGMMGAVITVILLLVGIFADLLSPYGMNEVTENMLQAPSSQHLLGTDNLGRDLLSRIIYGARVSVIVGLSATTLGTIITTLLGLISGYFGGKVDLVMQRFVDAWMCFPGIILMMIIITVIGTGMLQVIIVLSLILGIGGSRIIRGAVMSIREEMYVQAGESIGCSTTRILARHVLPNIMGPVLMIYSVRVAEAILLEATLSFLGFGIPPPAPSWGGMLSGTGRTYMFRAPWLVIWPGVALTVVVYGVNMFGDAVRDILDPRLRGRTGRFGLRATKRASKQIEK